jgi:L-asparaginase
MNPAEWAKIATVIADNYKLFDGFVVSWFWYDVLQCISIEFYARKFSKACNFTGSQLPIGDLRTDAKENLIGHPNRFAKWKRSSNQWK